jgi:hypothetical protein
MKGQMAEFTERLTDNPIVLVIHGSDYATFSIVVQPIIKGNEKFSYITLSEDVEFKVKVAPNKFEIFEIVPLTSRIHFEFQATGTLHVCLLDENWMCVEENSAIPNFANKGDIKIEEFQERRAYVRISNPSSDRLVEVTTIFHSKLQ